MKQEDTSLAGCVGYIVIFIVALVIAAGLAGVVVSQLWMWFIVPLGVAAISVPHAIGISMLIGWFTAKTSSDDVDSMVKKNGLGRTLFFLVGKEVSRVVLYLIFGALIAMFMRNAA